MKVNTGKTFKTLFLKELREERGWILFFIGALFILDIFLASRIGEWDRGVPFVISLFLPLIVILFLSFFRGYQTFREEWNQNTQQFLLAIPVRGYILVLAKFLALFVEILLLSFLSMLLSYFVSNLDLGKDLIHFNDWLRIWVLYFLIAFPFSSLSISVYLFSRCFRRFRGLWIAISYIGAYIFVKKTLTYGAAILSFLPKIRILTGIGISEKGIKFQQSTVSQGFYYYVFLGLFVLLIASFLLDRWVEA